MPSSPWGRLPECPGKSTAMQRDFSATAQSSQKPEEPVRQIPAVFEGLGGQELEQSLGGMAFPAQPLFISSVSPVLPEGAGQTPRARLTPRICGIGQLSWG